MKNIITISREFSSGGKEIGKRLADKLGYAFYDSEIISLLSKETGESEKYIENIAEKGIYPSPFNFGKTFYTLNKIQTNQNEILIKQSKIIKKLAEKGNCVIVGRGANVILKDYTTFDIFVYANMPYKIERCKNKASENENLTDKELEKKIKEVDKNRKYFHELLSNKEWGNKENYDLLINTTNINIKDIINPLSIYVENYFKGVK